MIEQYEGSPQSQAVIQSSIPGAARFRLLDLHELARACDIPLHCARYLLDNGMVQGQRDGLAWRIPYREALVAVALVRLREQSLGRHLSMRVTQALRPVCEAVMHGAQGRIIIALPDRGDREGLPKVRLEASQLHALEEWRLGTTKIEAADLVRAVERG